MEVSFGELVLIALIALVVLGPKELALRAHQAGQWVAKMRTEMNNFKILAQERLLEEQKALPKIDIDSVTDKKPPV